MDANRINNNRERVKEKRLQWIPTSTSIRMDGWSTEQNKNLNRFFGWLARHRSRFSILHICSSYRQNGEGFNFEKNKNNNGRMLRRWAKCIHRKFNFVISTLNDRPSICSPAQHSVHGKNNNPLKMYEQKWNWKCFVLIFFKMWI